MAAVIDGQSTYKNKIVTTEIADIVSNTYHNNRSYTDSSYKDIGNINIDDSSREEIPKIKRDIKIDVKDPSSVAKHEASDAMSLGYNEFDNGNINEASRYYKIALKKDKNNIEAMFGVGTCYQVLGQNDDALKYYLDILKINPRHAPAINNLMLILAEKDLDIAIKTLQKITNNNTDSLLLSQLGSLINQTGEYSKSLRCFKIALENDPQNPLIMYNLAITFDTIGNKQSALKFYKSTLMCARVEHEKLINIDGVKTRIKELTE
jgi:tetratricopeptide (TPR) repeat protein